LGGFNGSDPHLKEKKGSIGKGAHEGSFRAVLEEGGGLLDVVKKGLNN